MMGEPLHLFPHLLDRLQPISDGLTRVSQQNTLISPARSKINNAQSQLFTDTHSKMIILDTYESPKYLTASIQTHYVI